MPLDWTRLERSLQGQVEDHIPKVARAREDADRYAYEQAVTMAANHTEAVAAAAQQFTPPPRAPIHSTIWSAGTPHNGGLSEILSQLHENQILMEAMGRAQRQSAEALAQQLRECQRRADLLESRVAAQESESIASTAAGQRLENAGLQLASRQDQCEARTAAAKEQLAALSKRVIALEASLQGQVPQAELQNAVTTLVEPLRLQMEGKISQVARGVGMLSESLAARPNHEAIGGGMAGAMIAADMSRLGHRMSQLEGRIEQGEATLRTTLARVREEVGAVAARAAQDSRDVAAAAASVTDTYANVVRDVSGLRQSNAKASEELGAFSVDVVRLKRKAEAWDRVERASGALEKHVLAALDNARESTNERIESLAEDLARERRSRADMARESQQVLLESRRSANDAQSRLEAVEAWLARWRAELDAVRVAQLDGASNVGALGREIQSVRGVTGEIATQISLLRAELLAVATAAVKQDASEFVGSSRKDEQVLNRNSKELRDRERKPYDDGDDADDRIMWRSHSGPPSSIHSHEDGEDMSNNGRSHSTASSRASSAPPANIVSLRDLVKSSTGIFDPPVSKTMTSPKVADATDGHDSVEADVDDNASSIDEIDKNIPQHSSAESSVHSPVTSFADLEALATAGSSLVRESQGFSAAPWSKVDTTVAIGRISVDDGTSSMRPTSEDASLPPAPVSPTSLNRAGDTAQCTFCLRRMPRLSIPDHKEVCELRMVACPHNCGARILVRNLDRHAATCRHRPDLASSVVHIPQPSPTTSSFSRPTLTPPGPTSIKVGAPLQIPPPPPPIPPPPPGAPYSLPPSSSSPRRGSLPVYTAAIPSKGSLSSNSPFGAGSPLDGTHGRGGPGLTPRRSSTATGGLICRHCGAEFGPSPAMCAIHERSCTERLIRHMKCGGSFPAHEIATHAAVCDGIPVTSPQRSEHSDLSSSPGRRRSRPGESALNDLGLDDDVYDTDLRDSEDGMEESEIDEEEEYIIQGGHSKELVRSWTRRDVSQWIRSELELPAIADMFYHHRINGASLLDLTETDLEHDTEGLGISDPVARKRILAAAKPRPLS